MSHDDLLRELIKLIKYYRQIIYNYKLFPNNYYNSNYTLEEAEKRLEYYKNIYRTNKIKKL